MKPEIHEETMKLAEQQASFFRIFGNPQRLLILWILMEKECTVNEIALAIGLTLVNTYHHMRILEMHDLVKSDRGKQLIYYKLVDKDILQNCRIFAKRPEIIMTETDLISSSD